MDSKPCQEWRLQPQPRATDIQPQHDLSKRLTVEQCLLPASGGDTETSGAAVNELSQKWDYTFTSREPHILSARVDIDRSGEESLNCLHISSLSSIVEICPSLGIETRIIRRKKVMKMAFYPVLPSPHCHRIQSPGPGLCGSTHSDSRTDLWDLVICHLGHRSSEGRRWKRTQASCPCV